MERVFGSNRLGASVLLLIGIPLLTAALVDGRPDDPNPRDWARSVVDTLSLSRIAGKVLLVQDETPPEPGSVADPDDPLADALERTEAGGAYVCLSDLANLRSRVRRIRSGRRLPVALYLDPRCSFEPSAGRGLQAGWSSALLASRDPELARQIGRTLGQAARSADLDGVYVPRLARTVGPALTLRPADSIRRSARRLERGIRAGIREAGVGVARADTGYRAASPSDRPIRSLARGPASTAPHSILGADSIAQAAQQAVRAGAPRVVVPVDDRTAQRALVRAVRQDELAEGRLRLLAEQALAEAYRMRRSALPPAEHSDDPGLLVSRPPTGSNGADSLRREVDRKMDLLQDQIDRRSITLLRNRGELLPKSPTDSLRILHVAVHGRIGSDGDRRPLTSELQRAAPRARLTHRSVGPETRGEHFRDLTDLADDQDLVVVSIAGTYSAGSTDPSSLRSAGSPTIEPDGAMLTARQRNWIDNLNEGPVPLAIAGLNAPGVADALDRPDALLLTYTTGAAAHRAVAQALFGRIAVQGRLPGHLSSTYGTGHGLELAQVNLRRGPPEAAGMDRSVLERIDRVLRRAIADSAFPGAALAVGRAGVLVKLEGYGHHTYESLRPVTPESPFDLASLTKVVATTPAVMRLYESDRISLDAPVTEYWPAFGTNGKERVTVRHLLTHTSGLRPFHHPVHLVPGNPFAHLPLPYTPFYRLEMLERSDMYGFIARDTLQYTPGTEQVYSDLGMITMAHLVERITDRPLGDFLQDQLYDPLGMHDTGFRKTGPRSRAPHVVPTERDYSFRLRTMRGEVHDEAAYIMGGTSGHAGLFSTAQDLARYADMLIRSGEHPDSRFYRRETIDLFTRAVSPDRHTRALGWDTKSPDGYSSAGDLFGPESFGHTGFTGTSLWIDPEQELFVVLLTNRVHPNRFNRKHIDIRPKVADLAYRALRGAPTTLAEAPSR